MPAHRFRRLSNDGVPTEPGKTSQPPQMSERRSVPVESDRVPPARLEQRQRLQASVAIGTSCGTTSDCQTGGDRSSLVRAVDCNASQSRRARLQLVVRGCGAVPRPRCPRRAACPAGLPASEDGTPGGPPVRRNGKRRDGSRGAGVVLDGAAACRRSRSRLRGQSTTPARGVTVRSADSPNPAGSGVTPGCGFCGGGAPLSIQLSAKGVLKDARLRESVASPGR